MPKVAITTTSFGEYDTKILDPLKKEGFEVVLNPYGRKLNSREVVELCKGAVGIIAGTELLNADILEKLNMLKVVSRCGTGIDNVDMDAAARLGVKVFNTPDAPTLSVAELTIGLIISLLRKVVQMDTSLRCGKWKKLMGNLLSGKRVGVIGLGRIGKIVAELLEHFGCVIAYADPRVASDVSGLKCMELKGLLSWADIITLHVSTKDKVLGLEELKLMKNGSWLINVSRGGVVDEKALCECLKSGQISGAALDVFEEEPYDGPLKELDNVILTPHIGSYAKEARVQMEMQAVRNLLKGLEGESK